MGSCMHCRAVTWLLLLSLSCATSAQLDPISFVELPWPMDTGWVSNGSAEQNAGEQVVSTFTVNVPAAGSLRLHFSLAVVGTGHVRATSLLDGAQQLLTATNLQEWTNTTAYFNGNAVLVELLEPAGAGPWRLLLDSVEMGIVPIEPKSLCGLIDDRLPSADPRVARLLPGGCTAWIIDDCAHCLLTAGHCTGPLDVIEFNVPPSTLFGEVLHPGPEHQYVVDRSSQQSNGGGGVGNDWAYFGVFPNPMTGLTPGQAQGTWFELAPPPAMAGQALRVTGYGTDDSIFNQTQQTALGPFTAAWGTTLQYAVDTTSGGSGSPIVLESTGEAIGIHTHAGCTLTGGANQGMSSAQAALLAALADPQGVCRGTCGWTDLGGALSGSFGMPQLVAVGAPLDGSEVLLTVTGLPMLGATNMVTGFSSIHAPFKGGVLVPAPDLLVAGLPVLLGTCIFAFTFPPEAPSGMVVVFQFWTPDSGAPQGLSASNGVQLQVP
jgi:hypothetical protein